MTTIIYKNIRNGYARVDKEGTLVISIPNKLKNNESFQNALLEKGNQLLARYKKKTHILTSDKDSVMLFGERTPITDIFKEHEAASHKPKAQRKDHAVGSLSAEAGSKPAAGSMKLVAGSLKLILEEYSLPILDHYSEKLGIKYRKLSIRKTSSKRGSCTSDQKISLNLQLVHLPTKFIKYVIIHEACHLKIKNHSKRFRELVEKHCPNYKLIKKEMRRFVLH